MTVVQTRVEAARLLGVDERTIGNWRDPNKYSGFPDVSNGWDLDAIRAWRDANVGLAKQADEQLTTINKAIKLEKLNEIKRKNALLQIEIDKANRDLLPRAVIHDVLMEVASGIRNLSRDLQRSGNVAVAKMIEQQMGRVQQIVSDRLGAEAKPGR